MIENPASPVLRSARACFSSTRPSGTPRSNSRPRSGIPTPGAANMWRALSLVLMHELIRLERTTPAAARPLRGGLPAWQQKRVIGVHRRASRGGDFAGRSRRARRSKPLSFCARLHAILRCASASLPYGPPDGSRQGPVAEAGSLGDADRHPDWLSRNEFIYAGHFANSPDLRRPNIGVTEKIKVINAKPPRSWRRKATALPWRPISH